MLPLSVYSHLIQYLVDSICRCGSESNTVLLFLYLADTASLYMLSSDDVQLFEVKAFEEDFHSWFVGQTVQRGWSHFSLHFKLLSNLNIIMSALLPADWLLRRQTCHML